MIHMEGITRRLEKVEEQKPRMIDFLRRMIQTPSLSGEEGPMADLVAREMEALGYEVDEDGMGNVIGRIKGGKGRMILFDGHLDHIQPGDPSSWKHAPYSAEVVDDLVYGRGTVDMKGALAAMIYGCASASIEGEVVLTCVVHEETNEGVATRAIIEERDLKPAGCVLGEPTDLKLSIGQRGRSVFRIVTKGATSHASMPELGTNAIYKMAPILEGIKEANKSLPSDPFLGSATMVVTTIDCRPGVGPIVPDYCEIQVDRRQVPQETLEGVLNEMRELAEGAEVELLVDEVNCYTGRSLKVSQYFPGWITDPHHWLVTEGQRALAVGLGDDPDIVGWRFSTNGVATAGELEIPTIGFGPGDPALAHQPDEHISITDVSRAARGFCTLTSELTRSP
jgi:putative selenium metabolism hydrolase